MTCCQFGSVNVMENDLLNDPDSNCFVLLQQNAMFFNFILKVSIKGDSASLETVGEVFVKGASGDGFIRKGMLQESELVAKGCEPKIRRF